jgi:hypothetical protein
LLLCWNHLGAHHPAATGCACCVLSHRFTKVSVSA